MVAAALEDGAPVRDVPIDGFLAHAAATTISRAHFLTDISRPV
jgi:hypothetical protein